MSTIEKILELGSEGGSLIVNRIFVGYRKDNTPEYFFKWSTSEMGLEDNETISSSNIDSRINDFDAFFNDLNKIHFTPILYPIFIHNQYKLEIIKHFRKLIGSDKIKINDFNNIDRWLECLNVNQYDLTTASPFYTSDFIESINKFTKHNWFIAEQSGWNRIDMTHSNFTSEKEYTKFLLNENQKNADGYLNDLNKSGLYCFFYGDKCLYIGKAKKILNRLVDHYKSSTNYIKPNNPKDGRRQRELFHYHSKEKLSIFYICLDDKYESKTGELIRGTIEGMLQLELKPEFDLNINYT